MKALLIDGIPCPGILPRVRCRRPVSRARKILDKILDGRSDQNVPFDDLCYILDRAGFSRRHGSGSHRIFFQDRIPEIINIQPNGKMSKAYQVKQVRNLLVRYKIEVK